MKITKHLATLILLTITLSGCATTTPETIGDVWKKQPSAFPGFNLIGGLIRSNKNDIANFCVTRVIATDNGSKSNIVKIFYSDLSLNAVDFDPQLVVSNVLQFSVSLPGCQLFPSNSLPDAMSFMDNIDIGNLKGDLDPLHLMKVPNEIGQQLDLLKSLLASRAELENLLKTFQQFRSFQNTNFQSILYGHLRTMLDDKLAAIAQMATNTTSEGNFEIHVSLDAIMAAYLKAYLDGTFVDRWGNPLSQPDLQKLGNDSISPLSKVALEAVFDYTMMTPIIHDTNSPSSTNKTPTFAVLFPQLYEDLSTNSDAPGITAAESETIRFFSNLSGEGGKHLSSFVVKSVGGASYGAKISVGDNSTFAEFTSTFFEECFRRNCEEPTYDLLERFQYYQDYSKTIPTYRADTEANDKNLKMFRDLYSIDHPSQDFMVAVLISQDNLKQLLQGGTWSETNTLAAIKLISSAADSTNPDHSGDTSNKK